MSINTSTMTKAKTGPTKGRLFPQRWVSGPDPLVHKKYRVWIQQRNQARWRGEPWHLTFEDWVSIWGDQFGQRGQDVSCLCMTRTDHTEGWTKHNVEIISREEHFAQHRQRMAESKRKLNGK